MKKDMGVPPYILVPGILLSDKNITAVGEKLYGMIYWMSKMTSQKCFASNATLSRLLKCTPQTVANSLSELERGGYIKRTFKDPQKKNRHEIIPLIDFSVDYSYKESSAEDEYVDYSEEESSITPISNRDYSYEEHSSNITNNKNNITITDQGKNPLNKTIALFNIIVPGDFVGKSNAYSKLPTREAVFALLNRYSHEQIKELVEAYAATEGQEYRPSVGTVYEFCTYKLAKIESFLKKPRSRIEMMKQPYKKEIPTKAADDWGKMVRTNEKRRAQGLKPYKTEQEMYDDESKK